MKQNRVLMKVLNVFCVFAFFLIHSCQTSRQCSDGTVVGMTSLAAMTRGRDIRQTYGRGYLMTNKAYVSQCCGVVRQWTFSLDRSAMSNPVIFHVWRPVEGSNTYILVGKTEFYVETRSLYSLNGYNEYSDDYVEFDDDDDDDDDDEFEVDDDYSDDDSDMDDDDDDRRPRVMSVAIPEHEHISIREGDVIGWRSPGGDVISYTTRYYNLDNVVVNRMREVEVGDSYVFPRPLVMSHRTYGINAILAAGAAPVITNLPASVRLYNDATEGKPIFNVTGYDANPEDVVMFLIPSNEDADVTNDPPFFIDPLSGLVLLKQKPLHSYYDVTVVMADACGLYDVETLTVRVVSSKSPLKITVPRTLAIPVTDSRVDYTYNLIIEKDGDDSDDDGDDDVICRISGVKPAASLFVMKGTVLHALATVTDAELYSNMTYDVSVTCTDGNSYVTETLKVTLFHHTPPTFANASVFLHVSAREVKSGDIIYVSDVIYLSDVRSSELLPVVFWTKECNCPFYLHPDGSVALTRSLMSEAVTSYVLEIYVNDSVVTTGPSILHLILTDINQAPRFLATPSSVLLEELQRGVVLHLNVTDADHDPTAVALSWRPRTSGNWFFFNQSRRTIEVKPLAVLDYETLDIMGMTWITSEITVSDGFKTSSANVTLIITDVNEAPDCSHTVFFITVKEGKKGTLATRGTFLTSSCYDPESQRLRYVISEPSSVSYFTIDSYDASLIYVTNVDVNFTTMTSFIVRIADPEGLNMDVQLEVEIQDTDKKPQLRNLPRRLAVSEAITPGRLFSLEMVDQDEDFVSVHFRVLEGDPELFEIQGRELHLKQSRHLNYELTSSHVIEFVADNGLVTSEPAILTLDITDVNEAPVFVQDSVTVTVEEGETGTVVLSNLHTFVLDPDIQDNLIFSLLTFTEHFTIHSATGGISMASEYDVDRDVMPPNVMLIVKAVDSGRLSATVTVNIRVVNKNEPPWIVNLPRDITVPEDAECGIVIYRVVTDDPDDDDVIVRMSHNNSSGNLFFFNETDGTLILNHTQGLDFETASQFILNFTADDGVLTSLTVMLTLHVRDVNEAPYFTRDVFYISANEGGAGTVIGDGGMWSSARDPDDDSLTFDLLPTSHAPAFSIDTDTAELMFATDFLLTRQNPSQVVNLTIVATDFGNLTASSRVVVTVHDLNTRPRLLHLPSNITVHEATPEWALLYTVYAEDDDRDTVLFRLNNLVLQGRERFHLNSTTGELYLRKGAALTRRQISYFSLQISVTDGLLSSQAAILGIFVVGDTKVTTADVMSDYFVIDVKEDELDFPIPLPKAMTSEISSLPSPLSYHISGGSGQDHVHMDPTSGILLFNGNYDIDDPYVDSTLTLDVSVVGGSGKKWIRGVKINIIDINDNAPEVTSNLLTLFVSKASPIGTVIGYIEARDLDRGANGRLNYTIDYATVPKDAFKINSAGALTVSRALSSIPKANARLEVVIADSGQPPLSTSVGVFLVFT